MRTRDVRRLIGDLRHVLDEQAHDATTRGEALLERIFAFKLDNVVRDLLPLFRDEIQLQDLMWSMLHGIERVPGPSYAEELIAGLPALRSVEWGEVIMLRAIRDPETCDALRTLIPAASEKQRRALDALLNFVIRENPKDAELARELLEL